MDPLVSDKDTENEFAHKDCHLNRCLYWKLRAGAKSSSYTDKSGKRNKGLGGAHLTAERSSLQSQGVAGLDGVTQWVGCFVLNNDFIVIMEYQRRK